MWKWCVSCLAASVLAAILSIAFAGGVMLRIGQLLFFVFLVLLIFTLLGEVTRERV